ncbi:Short repeat of unknown function [Lachnospiraceae bacterium]|nr:Short repeat of unknown function [Lachnospiraceae bacterium]
MTIFQRIRNFFIGVIMLVIGLVFFVAPSDEAYSFVIIVLSIGLLIKGIKDICFYFVMARHMVGGKMILFQGVVFIDFAMVTGSFTDIPKIYILLYLAGIHAFSGVVEILRAMEAKRSVEGPWKMKMSHGVINFIIAVSCLIFLKKTDTAVIIYSMGLMYSAVIRIISAFRRTAFVLIK